VARTVRNATTGRARATAAAAGRRQARQAQTPPENGTDPSSRRNGAAAAGGTPAQTRELRARGQRTLRTLLDAGVEVFETRGYHAARVDDVVKLARTSHGTFYLYFANKEDLFRALMAEVADQMQQLAEDLGPLTPGPEGRAELQAWIARFADLYERYGAIIRAWTEAEIGSHEFGRLGTDVLTRFTRVLTVRIAAAAPPDLDPVIAALAIVAMLERLNYYVLSRHVRVGRAQMVETLARVTHAALFGAV
jgi:AcrR family transcriptional regulator